MIVFFDLDRTLIDFENGEDMGIKAVFETYQNEIKMNFDEFQKKWKVVAQQTFDEYSAGLHTFDQQRRLRVYRMFEINGIKLNEEEADKRFKLYWSTYEKGVEIFSDAKGILENLSKNKIPTGLISNGDSANQRWKLNKVNITDYFNSIIISDEVGVSKPDLKIFQIAMEKCRESKENIWYIGDSLVHDIEPALKFGINVIYLNRKMQGADLEEKGQSPYYFEVNSLDSAWKVLKDYS